MHATNSIDNWIFKTLHPLHWNDTADLSNYTLTTTKVNLNELESTEVRICPGIYQYYIKKQYDLRIVILGNTALSAIIQPREETGEIDWKFWQVNNFQIFQTNICNDLFDKCLQLLKRLNLVSGIFDFIVDENGTHWFLEINPAGNNLFLEYFCPDIPILEAWCQFMECSKNRANFRIDNTRSNSYYVNYY